MDFLFLTLLRLLAGISGSCQDDVAQLYKELKALQQIEYSWLEQWHTNYCYRTYNGDLNRGNRLVGGDFTLFHHGKWHPHTYGTEEDERDAIVFFDKRGLYHPHLYIEERNDMIASKDRP